MQNRMYVSKWKEKKDNTNHYNLSNVFKSTVCNATILNSVAHKSKDLSQCAAKHLHLENITQSEVKTHYQYGGIPNVKLCSAVSDPFMVVLYPSLDLWEQKGFNSSRCGRGGHSWPTAKMAHSVVFHSQTLSSHFTAENCCDLWSCAGLTNQHLAPRWRTNTEAVTRPAEQLGSAGDMALPPLPQSLERLSTSVSTIETKRHPQHLSTLQTIHVSSEQTPNTLRLLTLTQAATCWMARRK